MKLTSTGEEYLKTIFLLESKNIKVRVTDIANELNRSKATVNAAVKNLANEGLITYETYGDISLTDLGKQEGIKILEAYDIVKLFLEDVLKVSNSNLQKEAAQIKSILSDDSLNKLAVFTHESLGLHSLACGYDIAKEKCRHCLRRKTNSEGDEC